MDGGTLVLVRDVLPLQVLADQLKVSRQLSPFH